MRNAILRAGPALLIAVAVAHLLVTAGPRPAAGAGSTEIVSLRSNGNQGNQYSDQPSISEDGRFVAFQSFASDLVDGDGNGTFDVFVRDRQTGETERVSVDSAGDEGSQASEQPAVSADGRFVAFRSAAPDLVGADTNGQSDVFVHDRQTGQTKRVSIASDGGEGQWDAANPSISADGRYVAFRWRPDNFVLAGVYVRDQQTATTERVSLNSDEELAWTASDFPSISGDGRYVAFQSTASNLADGDTNGASDIFVRDRQTGTTERVSVDSDGTEGDGDSFGAAISADGRYVAFESTAPDLVDDDGNGVSDIFVHDRQTGETWRVSVDSEGAETDTASYGAAISADGRYVAFQSRAPDLVGDDGNGMIDVFVHDTQTEETQRASIASSGEEGDWDSQRPSISADGRYVAFQSAATTLVADDDNDFADIFVRDRGPEPTPTPTSSPTSTPTSSPTPTPAASPSPSPTPTPTEGPALTQGDVDCDEDVDSVDALKQLRHVAALSVTQEPGCPGIDSEVASLFGDVDCDSDVDSVDALKVLRYVAALPVSQEEPCPDIGGALG